MNIRGFQPNSLNEWAGHISAIIFFGGCNWKCSYCHNFKLQKNPLISKEEVLSSLKSMKYLDGVVLTGGEVTLQPELFDFIEELREISLKIKLSTNGTNSAIIGKLLSKDMIDCLCLDFKTLPKLLYSLGATVKDSSAVQETFDLAADSAIEREYRTTLCPAVVSKTIFEDMARQLEQGGLWILQQYETNVPRLDSVKSGLHRYSEGELEKFLSIAKQHHPNVQLRKGTP